MPSVKKQSVTNYVRNVKYLRNPPRKVLRWKVYFLDAPYNNNVFCKFLVEYLNQNSLPLLFHMKMEVATTFQHFIEKFQYFLVFKRNLQQSIYSNVFNKFLRVYVRTMKILLKEVSCFER